MRLMIGLTAMACSLTATVVLAQRMIPPVNEPMKRTPLQKTEYPDGLFTYLMMVNIAANAPVARHTHPGLEKTYVLDGDLELTIEGKPPQ
jgi:quercetin dioxygenase-like cupin family protein